MLLKNMKSKVSGNTFLKSIVLVAGGTGLAQVVGIISSPIITRLYTPEQFGILTVFMSILGIITPLSTLRYSVAIPIAEDDDTAISILVLCFLITLVMTAILFLTVILFRKAITEGSSVPEASSYLWFLPVCFAGAGFYESLHSLAIRMKDFKIIAKTRIWQGLLSAGTKISLGFLRTGAFGLLIGSLAAQAGGIGSFFRKLSRSEIDFKGSFSYKKILRVSRRFYRFPLFQTWSRLLLSVGVQLPALFLASLYGTEVAGKYGLANSMINLPMNLVGTSLAQVFYAEIASYGSNRPDKLLHITKKIIAKTMLISIIPVSLIFALGPWVFSFAFGYEWYEAGSYARAISLILITRLIASPVMDNLNVLEKQGTQLILNVFRVVLVCLVFVFSKIAKLSSLNALYTYSISVSIYYLVLIFYIVDVLKKRIRGEESKHV